MSSSLSRPRNSSFTNDGASHVVSREASATARASCSEACEEDRAVSLIGLAPGTVPHVTAARLLRRLSAGTHAQVTAGRSGAQLISALGSTRSRSTAAFMNTSPRFQGLASRPPCALEYRRTRSPTGGGGAYSSCCRWLPRRARRETRAFPRKTPRTARRLRSRRAHTRHHRETYPFALTSTRICHRRGRRMCFVRCPGNTDQRWTRQRRRNSHGYQPER